MWIFFLVLLVTFARSFVNTVGIARRRLHPTAIYALFLADSMEMTHGEGLLSARPKRLRKVPFAGLFFAEREHTLKPLPCVFWPLPSVFATRKMPEFCGDIYTIIKFGF
jgi:hypothetical protein